MRDDIKRVLYLTMFVVAFHTTNSFGEDTLKPAM